MTQFYHAVQQQVPLPIPSSICAKCHIEKPLEHFEFRRDQNKYRAYCKPCANAQALVRKKRYRQKLASLKTLPDPLPPGSKYCPRCKQHLPFVSFGSNKSAKDGLQSYCKSCRKDQRQESAEIISQQQRQYRQENRDKLREKQRRYYQERKDKIKAHVNQYRQEHQDAIRERKKREYQDQKDRIIERSIRYQREHKDEHNAQVRKYTKTPKGRLVTQASFHRRRALQRETGGSYTPEAMQDQIRHQKHKCYYCHSLLKKSNGKYAYHVEHIIPLSRGGSNDIHNIVASCSTCNLRKGNKLLHEWTDGGRLL